MANTQETTPSRWHPPYIAFRTITDLIERMEQEEPPARIDKSYLDNYSGGYQSIVLASLNNLGLRDESGAVTDRMLSLVKATPEERKTFVGEILREYYGPVLNLGTNATQAQLIEGFRDLGVNPGDTTRKVVAFFLAAARYAGIPVSRHWKVPRVPPSSGARKRSSSAGNTPDGGATGTDRIPPQQDPPLNKSNVRTVTLRSGGTVTLEVSVDLFDLSGDDETFVMGLIKTMRAYDDQRSLPPAPVPREMPPAAEWDEFEGEAEDDDS